MDFVFNYTLLEYDLGTLKVNILIHSSKNTERTYQS